MFRFLVSTAAVAMLMPVITQAQELALLDQFYARRALTVNKNVADSPAPAPTPAPSPEPDPEPAPEPKTYAWSYGDWSDWDSYCSTAENPSVRTRSATCLDEAGMIVAESFCTAPREPIVEESIEREACDLGGIKNGNFDEGLKDWEFRGQVAPAMKGGDAVLSGRAFEITQSVRIPAGVVKPKYAVIYVSADAPDDNFPYADIGSYRAELSSSLESGGFPLSEVGGKKIVLSIPSIYRVTSEESVFGVRLYLSMHTDGNFHAHRFVLTDSPN